MPTQVPAYPLAHVTALIEAELGQPTSEIFVCECGQKGIVDEREREREKYALIPLFLPALAISLLELAARSTPANLRLDSHAFWAYRVPHASCGVCAAGGRSVLVACSSEACRADSTCTNAPSHHIFFHLVRPPPPPPPPLRSSLRHKASIEPEPLGAASIGQVHAAVLAPAHGGREVVVKVQYPEVEQQFDWDMRTIRLFCNLAMPEHMFVSPPIPPSHPTPILFFPTSQCLSMCAPAPLPVSPSPRLPVSPSPPLPRRRFPSVSFPPLFSARASIGPGPLPSFPLLLLLLLLLLFAVLGPSWFGAPMA